MDDEKKYWVAFSVFPGIGPVRFKLLRDYFGSVVDAWNASPQALRKIHLGEKLVQEFIIFRESFPLDDYLTQLGKQHVHILTLDDPRYPKRLKEIPDAPFLLYIKAKPGQEKLNLDRTIAVVGTRKITHYGEEVTRRIVKGLVAHGFTIVSGMAYGVDAVAHQTAIDAGGKTIAVLGCGIDIIAPPSNARLYRAIGEEGGGAIVSEMPLGLRPNKGLFPARNRIISGLSMGVVVTEGADDSGALITARNATEQGREVFAIPGPITSPYSRGPASLIKKGAKLVERVEDILEELNINTTPSTALRTGNPANTTKTQYKADTKEEQIIIDQLQKEPMHIDEIVRSSGLTASAVAASITILEMKHVIRDYGEKNYGIRE
ncbi:MAG: DNA-processing protein DprA [Candidatus Gottesmanbacteria bacterium]|nr:DNA-processing protein DprA [Candidatus Gottesmanbacteria bacterium]